MHLVTIVMKDILDVIIRAENTESTRAKLEI